MLTTNQIDKLTANWGDKADALNCKAEVRIYDTSTFPGWECYVYAMNPDDNNTVKCIVKPFRQSKGSIEEWKISEIELLYNSLGEPPEIDKEFRPIDIQQLIKKIGMRNDLIN
jgi:hypothetical protein